MIEKYIKKFKGYDISIHHTQEVLDESKIQNNKVDNINSSEKEEYFITVYSKKGIGFVKSTVLNENVIRRAIKLSKINSDLKYYHGLPKADDTKNKRFYDKKLYNLSLEDIHKLSKEILKQRKHHISEGSVSRELTKHSIANSNGLFKEETKTYFSYDLSYVNKSTNFTDFGSYSYFPDLFSEIKKNSNALKFYSQRRVKKFSKNIVFSLKTLNELLSHAFLDNFSYENIEKGQSLLDFKKKFQFNTKFSLINDGTLKNGLFSSNFDHEGVRKSKSYLIRNGKVNSFLFNYNAAKEYGFKPGGNAYYSSVLPNNIVIRTDKFEPEEYIFIEEITGAHTANSVTTEFSILVNKAKHVSKEGTKPLKPFMINSSMISLFNNLRGSFDKEDVDLNLVSKKLVFSDVNLIY